MEEAAPWEWPLCLLWVAMLYQQRDFRTKSDIGVIWRSVSDWKYLNIPHTIINADCVGGWYVIKEGSFIRVGGKFVIWSLNFGVWYFKPFNNLYCGLETHVNVNEHENWYFPKMVIKPFSFYDDYWLDVNFEPICK